MSRVDPDYTPAPVNVSRVQESLVGQIAPFVHDSWAIEKLSQDPDSGHPDLIPFDELSEEVQEFDRVTIRTVLASLVRLGYMVIRSNRPEGIRG